MNSELFPRTFFVELARRRAAAASQAPGQRAVQLSGSTLPGYERRAWQRGDRRRQVDWRATARAGRTMVRQMEHERGGFLHLVLDRSASQAPGTADRDVAQRRLALALAWLALEDGARVRIHAGTHATAMFSGWSRRAAVVPFLRDLPAPEGTDALPVLATRPASGCRLHVLSDPWLADAFRDDWAKRACGFRHRRWTSLILPTEVEPPRERLQLTEVESKQQLQVDLDRDYAAFRQAWDMLSRSRRLSLQQAGFRPTDLLCRSASTDAAALLRRAATHAVL
ncbi:MAG: DUF58 domain-containing protein [Planctomycetota bacterium]